MQGQELVKGVNEGAQALEEEDSFTAALEQKASTSESKLMALLEEVRLDLPLSDCLSVCCTHQFNRKLLAWSEHISMHILKCMSVCPSVCLSVFMQTLVLL